jgi:putative membrane protein
MKNFLLSLVLSAIAVLIVAAILPGVSVEPFIVSVIVAAILAILNAVVKPVLVFLTIPITVVTLGLFLLVINTIIILLTDWLVPGFEVDGFWWAMLFSLLLSLVNAILEAITGR